MYLGDTKPAIKDRRWHLKPKWQAHEAIHGVMKSLRDDATDRRNDLLKYARLYGNKHLYGLTAKKYHKSKSGVRITLNVCKSVVNAYVAKLASTTPKGTYLTEGGDPTLQRKAKLRDKYVDGLAYEVNLNERRLDSRRDAAVWGTGITHFYVNENDKPCVDRVYPWELMVDDAQAMYPEIGPPYYYLTRYYDKAYLSELFPTKKREIERACTVDIDDQSMESEDSDQVLVSEAWHPSTSDKGENGRHIICIENSTLKDDKYKPTHPPFLFWHYEKPLMGFWGSGLIDEIVGIQVEINVILQDIQERFHLCSKPMILANRASKVIKQHFTNRLANVIEWEGVDAPQIVTFQTTHPEIFAHLETLVMRAYEIPGISQLSAQGKKPAGLNSGEAQRVYNDIENQRFADHGKRDEQWMLDANERLIDCAAVLDERGVELDVAAEQNKRGRTYLEVIKYEDIAFEPGEQLRIKAYPTSALPSQPAGKTATVQEWIAAGFIDQTMAKLLLDFPDLENAMTLDPAIASYRLILSHVERMLDDGDRAIPRPYQDLELSMTLVLAALVSAEERGAEEERLELLRDYLVDCEGLMAEQEPPVEDMSVGAEMMPPGAPPMAPPGMEGSMPPIDPATGVPMAA